MNAENRRIDRLSALMARFQLVVRPCMDDGAGNFLILGARDGAHGTG